MCWGWWKTVFIVWFAMAHIWTLFEKLCAVWGLFNSLSMGLGAQPATGCGNGWAKPVHGGSCAWANPHMKLWAGRTWATEPWLRSAWVWCWISQCPVAVSMTGHFGACELPPMGPHFPASQQSYGDQNSFRIVRCLISTLLRNSKNISHKKLSLFLPIIGTDKLVPKLLFSLCSNLGKFSNGFVYRLLTLGNWSDTSTGSEKQKCVANPCIFKPMA